MPPSPLPTAEDAARWSSVRGHRDTQEPYDPSVRPIAERRVTHAVRPGCALLHEPLKGDPADALGDQSQDDESAVVVREALARCGYLPYDRPAPPHSPRCRPARGRAPASRNRSRPRRSPHRGSRRCRTGASHRCSHVSHWSSIRRQIVLPIPIVPSWSGLEGPRDSRRIVITVAGGHALGPARDAEPACRPCWRCHGRGAPGRRRVRTKSHRRGRRGRRPKSRSTPRSRRPTPPSQSLPSLSA